MSMQENKKYHPNKLLNLLIEASAGSGSNFRATVLGQLAFGILYSFGYFDLKLVGLIIGYILPVVWVVSSYRFLKLRAVHTDKLPFPGFVKKDPGNLLVILIDIVFLTIIWFIILSELYDATWLRFVFTIVFPALTLSMMRSLVILPKEKEEGDG